MASIVKRLTDTGEVRYQAKIRKRGYTPQSETFARRKDAAAWASKIELAMDQGLWRDSKEAELTTLFDALDRYQTEVTVNKKSAVRETSRIERWKKTSLHRYPLPEFGVKILQNFATLNVGVD